MSRRRYLFLSIILHLVASLLGEEKKLKQKSNQKKNGLEAQSQEASPRHCEVPVQHSKVTLKQTLFRGLLFLITVLKCD